MMKNRKMTQILLFILMLFLLVTSVSTPVIAQSVNDANMEGETEVEFAEKSVANGLEVKSNENKDGPIQSEKNSSSSKSAPAITSGVYAISKQATTSYARCSTVGGGTYLSQQTFDAPPASESNRHAMFKIIYRASTDDYVIRNMVNNEVVIYADVGFNAPLSVKLPNTNDSQIPTDKAWKITTTSDGFYNISCKLNGTTYYMSMPTSGNLELSTNGGIGGAKWKFNKYTGATFRGWGKIGEWPEHIENGSSATIEAYIYSTEIGENRAWFVTSSVNPDVASAVWAPYSSKMTITPKYGGSVRIRLEANVGNIIYENQLIMAGWDTGSFFIKNRYSSEYLTALDGVSDTELRLTSLPDGNDKEYTLWNMEYWGNGYYKIIQDVTGDCIYGNNPTTSNLEGKPWANAVWQQTLWKFIPKDNGVYKIQSYYHVANHTGNYVSLDDTSTKNIRSLASTGTKQLWRITPAKFNIKILYDQAFVDRHGSSNYMNVLNHVFGDNSIGNSIADALFNQLKIRFSFTFESTSTNTFKSYPYANGCLRCSDKDDFCLNHSSNSSSYTCSTLNQTTVFNDCTNSLHHKRWDIFDNNIPASSSYIPILFTGHNGCGVDTKGTESTLDDEHIVAQVAGYANWKGGTCIVILNRGNVSSTGDGSARLLLHEIIHIFNAPDNTQNYGEKLDPNYDPTQAYRMDCVMGYNRYKPHIQEELTICEYCKNIAKLYKYSFYNH